MKDTLTPEQSLALIHEMIRQAKQKISNNSFFFLVWGWLLMLAGLAEYALQHMAGYKYFYIVWPVASLFGGIASAVYGFRQKKEQTAQNMMNKAITYTWYGFIITLVILIVTMVAHRINPGPFIMVLTGFPTFVTGSILRFKPLIAGGVIFWVLGILSFIIFTDASSLLFSLSVLLGYIIPGYLLRNMEKTADQNTVS